MDSRFESLAKKSGRGRQKVVRIVNPRNSCYGIAVVNLLLSSEPFVAFLELCQSDAGIDTEPNTLAWPKPTEIFLKNLSVSKCI